MQVDGAFSYFVQYVYPHRMEPDVHVSCDAPQ
jgi:hypothetical protein